MKVTDPVCGMIIDTEKAEGQVKYQGTTYYFCSADCKAAFEKTPEKYLQKKSDRHGH